MSDGTDTDPRDAELVAFIDGTLPPESRARLIDALAADPGLAVRLGRLAAGGGPFSSAFAALPPPPESLDRALADALRATAPQPVRPVDAGRSGRWSLARLFSFGLRPSARLAAVAVLLAVVLAGLGAIWYETGRSGDEAEQTAESPEDWREAVAQYLTLYTGETFADLPDDAAQRRSEILGLGRRLGIDLRPWHVALPGLAVKRAQLFNYDGFPLGQIAYLDEQGAPVVFCIVAEPMPDASPTFETRHGIGIVFWSKAGRGYMLAGRLPEERLMALAGPLVRQMAS